MSRLIVGLAAILTLAGCSLGPQRWSYERTEDKLRDSVDVVAKLQSNEPFEVHGTTYRITLAVERHPGGPDFAWFPNRSECSPQNPILFRLDDGPIETVPCIAPTAGTLWTAQMDESVVRRIERAKVMIAEIPGPNYETERLTFNVAGLSL